MKEVSLKRFVIFSFENNYPCGGMNDLDRQADSLEEANQQAQKIVDGGDSVDVIQILDLETRKHWTFYKR